MRLFSAPYIIDKFKEKLYKGFIQSIEGRTDF